MRWADGMMGGTGNIQYLPPLSNPVHKGGHLVTRLIDYTKARQCRNGGFCFYRLEEPNGSDTYYAVSILTMLGIGFHDDKTVRYLIDQQRDDGSYKSIFSAYYSVSTLSLMGERPAHDPSAYLLDHVDHYRFDPAGLPAEVTSLFKKLLFLIDLCALLDIRIANKNKRGLFDFVMSFSGNDGGFGHGLSSLVETAHALSILTSLGYSLKRLKAVAFIRSCETPLSGFTGVPGTSLSYIEHVNGGIRASELIHYRPRYINECFRFISGCQTKNGGFSRGNNAGISTLENSYYAVDSLARLSRHPPLKSNSQ